MSKTCVVVGGSHAAASFVSGLRQEGWEDRIVMVSEEAILPYHRPPLSKEYLAGKKTLDEIYLRPAEFYEEIGAELKLDTRVESIETDAGELRLAGGEALGYDTLCLTVGSLVRKVDLPGVDLDGVHYLRTTEDVEHIRADIKSGGKAVVVGGGYIGLEVAAVLNKLGMQVTVLEMMERVMERVTAPVVSEFYTRVHIEEGVDVRCGVGVTGFEGNGRVTQVLCSDDSRCEADLVVIGVGIVPNVALAKQAGLEIDNGIVVDEYTRTSHPDIYAAGDCTFHYNPIYDRRVRLESVQNATDQGRAAAANVCGKDKPYRALPWFWSDQYDVKLQIAGLSEGYDDIVVRGEPESGHSFSVFYLRRDRLIAVDAINSPAVFMAGKKLLTGEGKVDRERLADESVHVRELLK